MAIGDKIQNRFTAYRDSYTGVTVERLTEPGNVSHHMYFYNRMSTADGKKLLYCAEAEERRLYLMDMETGEAVQLTEGGGLDDYGGILSSDDKYVYYQQEKVIWKLALSGLERECVYRIAEGWTGDSWTVSGDGRYLSVIETLQESLPKREEGAGWDFFAKTCLAKPRCRIVYVDLASGTSRTLLEENCWLGHVQIRPKDPDTIMFCHEGPYDLIDARLWLVQSDGSRCREQPDDLILTHEFWLPDGSRLAFVYRETTGEKREDIRMINPDTMEEEVWMRCSPYAHFICDRQNHYMVGDAQGSDVPIHLLDTKQPGEADGGKADGEKPGETHKERTVAEQPQEVRNDFIYLVDVEGRSEERLCYHGTSWSAAYGNPQDSHPHPCFTEDGKYVIFVSDREGTPCIYRVKLQQKGD